MNTKLLWFALIPLAALVCLADWFARYRRQFVKVRCNGGRETPLITEMDESLDWIGR